MGRALVRVELPHCGTLARCSRSATECRGLDERERRLVRFSGDAIIHDAFRPSVTGSQSGLVRCSQVAVARQREGGEEGGEGRERSGEKRQANGEKRCMLGHPRRSCSLLLSCLLCERGEARAQRQKLRGRDAENDVLLTCREASEL